MDGQYWLIDGYGMSDFCINDLYGEGFSFNSGNQSFYPHFDDQSVTVYQAG